MKCSAMAAVYGPKVHQTVSIVKLYAHILLHVHVGCSELRIHPYTYTYIYTYLQVGCEAVITDVMVGKSPKYATLLSISLEE